MNVHNISHNFRSEVVKQTIQYCFKGNYTYIVKTLLKTYYDDTIGYTQYENN